MGKIRALAALIVLSVSSVLLSLSPASAKVIPQPNWAGYSGYTNGQTGWVNNVVASWYVPKISCTLGSDAATTVWAGIWGNLTSINANTAWLPQIGTSSLCDSGFANYLLAWQMYTKVPGGNSGARFGYACGNYYNVCNGDLPTENLYPYGTVVYVNAGDLVTASVEYNAPYPASGSHPRTFTISLVDDTTGKSAQGTVTTGNASTGSALPVSPAAILSQGGVMVEDAPAGLAQFSPFTVNASVYGPSSFGIYKWELVNGSDVLATLGSLVNTGAASPLDYNYKITWKNQS